VELAGEYNAVADDFDVRVSSTPSLSLRDNWGFEAPFVGYAKQRHRLLGTGAELYEMRPDAKSERTLFTPLQLSEHQTLFGLHAKTSVFDRKATFVGSFNVDPRSINLNTEMGEEPMTSAVRRAEARALVVVPDGAQL
jgi:putative cardiolipin synthase